MKVAWFTPFSRKSAIGGCSALIVAELTKHVTVDLWHPATDEPRETEVRTISFGRADEIDLKRLNSYDLVFYNFGNYLPFHREIFEISRRVPGVAVIHDFVMHHFFAGYYLEYLQSTEGYLQAVDRLYGEEARRRAAAGLTGEHTRLWESDEVVNFPFFEELLRGSYGAVVHSNFMLERARQIGEVPVRHIHLPLQVGGAGQSIDRNALGIPEASFLMVTVGHVNPNKRILEVIEALGSHRHLTRNLIYAVIGPYDDRYHAQLIDAIQEHGLQDVVRLTGYASDETLHAYLRLADLCVNLRYPAIEGGSASLVEEMLYGKAIIVTQTGIYEELPDACVWKIDPRQESSQLAAAVDRLVADESARNALGARAREYAIERHHATRYARDVVSFIAEVLKVRPLFQLADRVGLELGRLGVDNSMSVASSVGSTLNDLFGSQPDLRASWK